MNHLHRSTGLTSEEHKVLQHLHQDTSVRSSEELVNVTNRPPAGPSKGPVDAPWSHLSFSRPSSSSPKSVSVQGHLLRRSLRRPGLVPLAPP